MRFLTSARLLICRALLAGLCLSSALTLAQTTTTENFDTGTKPGYAAATVSLSTGTWTFTDALLGTDPDDHRTGPQAARRPAFTCCA